MVRSLPEKTLEHWVSFYINYRYHSYAGQWWPANGEDIAVNGLPARPGKILQFEVKSSEISGTKRDIHTVYIDRRQLCAYLRRPLGHQPYYLFCSPEWVGEFQSAAHHAGAIPSEFAFRRAGGSPLGGWFVYWSIVVSANDVNKILGDLVCRSMPCVCDDLQDWILKKRRRHSDNTWQTRWRTNANVQKWKLRDFLTHFERCGDATTSQIITVPRAALNPGLATRVELIKLLEDYQTANSDSPAPVVDPGDADGLEGNERSYSYVAMGDGNYYLDEELLSSNWSPNPEWVKAGRATPDVMGIFIDALRLEFSKEE